MRLSDLLQRSLPPSPWSEGEKIPWHEPEFSRRMLAEHLSQAHDGASRRSEIIDAQVEWIHRRLLAKRPSKILDLGCGPGLYAERLVALGHEVVGIDHSPASIAHAREHVPRATFTLGDIRTVDLSRVPPFSLAMLLFGEANAFRTEALEPLLARVHDALAPGGAFLIEAHAFEAVRDIGSRPASWYSAPHGLFSDGPHLCLRESFFHEQTATATERWWIIDAETSEVARHVNTLQAHTDDAYQSMLAQAGFASVEAESGLGTVQEGLFALVARKHA